MIRNFPVGSFILKTSLTLEYLLQPDSIRWSSSPCNYLYSASSTVCVGMLERALRALKLGLSLQPAERHPSPGKTFRLVRNLVRGAVLPAEGIVDH